MVWDFGGYAKNVGIFLGHRQVLKLGFFMGIKYEPLFDLSPPSLKYLGEGCFLPIFWGVATQAFKTDSISRP